jgi:hypothetical protein
MTLPEYQKYEIGNSADNVNNVVAGLEKLEMVWPHDKSYDQF